MHATARPRATNVIGAISLVLGLIISILALVAGPSYAVTEHCPGANEGTPLPSDYSIVLDNDTTEGYSQDDKNNTVLPAGTLVCVKGSTVATGIVTADGEKSLEEILGIDKDVSYYMTYTRTQEPEQVQVCNTVTGELEMVDVEDQDDEPYAPVDDDRCGEQEPEQVQVCDTTTGQVIEVSVEDQNDPDYAVVGDPGCDDVEPATAEVCNTETGQIVEISEDDLGDADFAAVDDAACQEVQGIVEEPEPTAAPAEEEPAELPATEVKGEQVAAGGELPNTGAEHVILGLFAGGFLMLGGAMLLLGDRRRGVIA